MMYNNVRSHVKCKVKCDVFVLPQVIRNIFSANNDITFFFNWLTGMNRSVEE